MELLTVANNVMVVRDAATLVLATLDSNPPLLSLPPAKASFSVETDGSMVTNNATAVLAVVLAVSALINSGPTLLLL
jgi:hypothetical protein